MSAADRYLLGRAGPAHISIRTQAIERVWRMDAAILDETYGAEPIDLRILLGGSKLEPGVAIAFGMDETVGLLIVNAVSGMASIPDDEFFALPQVFSFARHLFDAACRRPIEGAYPLRLRQQLNASNLHALAAPL
jgi:hypothetical protein